MRRILLILCALLAGCGGDGGDPRSARPVIVATTTHVADLARNAGGDAFEIRTLVPAGTDPHDHELAPSDAEAIADASLVLRSGGEIDEWVLEAVEGAGGDVRVIDVLATLGAAGDAPPPADAGQGAGHAGDAADADPHWWQDPRNAAGAVAAIADGLAAVAPGRAREIGRRSDRYVRRILDLDRAIAECMQRIPASRRKLVTTHESFGHYARRYGIEVIGTVIPSRSTQAQASAGDTARLVQEIRRAGVKTIFTEQALPAKLEEAIAREAGARVGKPLYADSLGERGSPGDTYLKALVANTQALVAGFTGRPSRCALPEG